MLFGNLSRLRTALQRSIARGETVNQNCVGVYCADLCAIIRPGFDLATSLEKVDQRRVLSLVGTLYRTFSIPSISGPSFQACGYHSDCALRESAQFSISRNSELEIMAVPLTRVVVGGHYVDNLKSKSCHQSLSKGNDSNLWRGGNVSMRLMNHKQPDSRGFYGYFIYNAAKAWQNYNPFADSGSRDFHSSSSTCFSAGPSPDVPFDSSVREEQPTNSLDSSDQYVFSFYVCLRRIFFVIKTVT